MTVIVTDSDSLKDFIKERTSETWDQRAMPYYLSFIATDLKKQGADYRSIIAPLKLSQWAASVEVPQSRLVKHPTQRARIGFVPADSDFEFSLDPVQEPTVTVATGGARGRALVQFVQSLADLDDEAIAQMQVPARTLIALLRK